MNNEKIAKAAFAVTAIIIGGKILGLVRDVTMAYVYGTSLQSDAFTLGQTIITLFSGLLFSAVGIAFIPLYTRIKLTQNRLEMENFLNSLYSLGGLITILVSAAGILLSRYLVMMMAPGFDAPASTVAVILTRIMFVSLVFSFWATIQGQQLRGEHRFIPVAFLAYPLNAALIIALLFFSPHLGIYGVAAAYVIGYVLQNVLLFPFVRKTGYRYHILFKKNKNLKELMLLTGPILLGDTVYVVNSIVDKVLASTLEEGSMAALSYASKLAFLLISLISMGAANVVYTKLAELGANKNFAELKIFLKQILNLINAITVPATAGLMVLSGPIIRFVYERGAFDSNSSQMTSVALFFYAIGLTFYVLRDILNKTFYSLSDSRTPMINGIISVIAGITFNLIMIRYMGIAGLALATSLAGILATLLLLISLRKKLGQLGFRDILKKYLKMLVAAVVMCVVVSWVYQQIFNLFQSNTAALMIAIFSGMIVYAIVLLCLKIEEVNGLVKLCFHKFAERIHR